MALSKLVLGSIAVFSTLVLAAPEGAPTPARPAATAFTADLTGLWYNPLENGWGVNIVQQYDVLFVTMFVYGPDNKPMWLFGSDVAFSAVDDLNGVIFTGDLYTATGSYYGVNFNPAQFGVTKVGTVTLRFGSYTTGTLSYTVNGVTVLKNIIPQTWKANVLAGNYLGAMSGATTCTLPLAQPNGLLKFNLGQSGSNATIQVTDATGAQCTLTGTITAYGKLMDIDGSYSCTGSQSGTFGIRRLEAGVDGMFGIYYSFGSKCPTSGATMGAALAGS